MTDYTTLTVAELRLQWHAAYGLFVGTARAMQFFDLTHDPEAIDTLTGQSQVMTAINDELQTRGEPTVGVVPSTPEDISPLM